MKAKKNLIVTIVLLVIFVAVVQVTHVAGKSEKKANTTPQIKFVTEKREILAGLQGVEVAVEVFEPEDIKYGFNRQQYQTDVELRLRQYGIKVLSNEESLKMAQPYLYINVNPLISEKGGIAAVSIEISLRDIVVLVRNPTIMTSATTWKRNVTSIVGFNRFNEIRNKVRDLVDIFINDYLAANPKEQPPHQKTEK
jgi:hypothetical protein